MAKYHEVEIVYFSRYIGRKKNIWRRESIIGLVYWWKKGVRDDIKEITVDGNKIDKDTGPATLMVMGLR